MEEALRLAIGHLARGEMEQIEPALAVLDDSQRAEALGLAAMISCYVVVDVCDAAWPNDANIRQIAEDLATTGSTAKRLKLDAGQIYAYLSRTVLGPEALEDVVPNEPMFTRLPLIVALQATAVYSPKGMDIYDYLDNIESAIEFASALPAPVLPAAVMLAYLPKPQAGEPGAS